MTYQAWLTEQLNSACDSAGDDHQAILDDIMNQADTAANDKTALI